ncbi:MAG: sterol desaturase family protein [Solirubrobacteraceae bacterium]|nr:sterol desaturase family protein [Solirubrobacteraceae bacterium]
MVDLLVAAIPAFILLMAVEALSYKHMAEDAREASGDKGYEARDTRTSISMGLGYLAISGGWNIVALVAFAAIYSVSPLRIDMGSPWSWLLLLVLFDLLFYWDHRVHHRVRAGWASHVVHHSSEHFNLSTAVRQPWTPFSSTVFFAPLPLLGFPPAAVATISAIDLLYQFWIHTERVDRLPRPIEFVMNTPSHHRVHHGSDQDYLDRNYGGVFIIFDRMFGTFTPEGARPTYGLTTNINTFNPLRVAFHEWQAIGRDVRRARTWRERAGYTFGPPGWVPNGEAAPTPVAAEPPAGDPTSPPLATDRPAA